MTWPSERWRLVMDAQTVQAIATAIVAVATAISLVLHGLNSPQKPA